ncbi:MAG TPA: NHL repeat-containing protein [Solirubrobacteraceae bacterium]|jgi:hypothetical protein
MSTTHHHQEKGTNVIHQERSSRTPHIRTGLFATLRGVLRLEGSGAPARRLGLFAALVIVSALTITAAPAFAIDTHVFSTDFAGGGSGGGQVALSAESGVAVNSTTHDVYVADTGNFRVDQFTSSGTFVRAWGWGVGDGLPTFETCTLSCQAGVSGSGAGQFTKPTFIAVDNSGGASKGDVYVGDAGDGLVSKFSPEGVLLEAWGTRGQLNGSTATAGSFGSVYGIAVDGSGALEVINSESQVFRFAQDASFTEELAVARGTAPAGLAVDPAGDLFKANGEPSIEEINAAGSDIGQVTSSISATALAVQAATGDLYVDEGGDIEHYVFAAPGVVSEQGGTSCDVESFVGCAASDVFGIGSLSGGAGIAVDPSSETAYVADTASQRIDVFIGPVLLPDATTEAPTAVSESTATLNGTVNPDGTEVKSCEFEYGSEPGVFNGTVPCAPVTPYNGSAPITVNAELDGLTMYTIYHYRLAVTNANGTNRGSDVSFTTPGPPRISAVSAQVDQSEKAGQTSATLNAQINPGGSETTYRFEYGEATAYGASIPVPDGALAASQTSQPVPTAEPSGLKLGTVYHYRLVAHNQYGTATSTDQTFSTLPAALLTASVSNVTATSAILEAQINPLGTDTTYYFQYGTTSCATSPASCTNTPVPAGEAGAGETEVQVPTSQIRGLIAGTTYHYRVIATNALGTVVGPEQAFTTQTSGTATLPDGRQWELVSPVDKHGALLEPSNPGAGVTQASANGDAISYLARTPTESEPAGNANYTQVLSTRGSASWGSRDITSPRDVPVGALGGDKASEYRFFSPDLATGIIQPIGLFTPSLSPEASEQTPFLHTDFPGGEPTNICSSSCYRPLVTGKPGVANVPPGTVFGEANICVDQLECGPRFEGASADGSHIVLSSIVAPLVEGAAPASLYEWVDGQLQVINVLPQDEGGGVAQGASLGGLGLFGRPVTAKAVSNDGSRVIWSTAGSGSALYLRDIGRDETVRLTSGGSGEPKYQTASADGGRVFFTQDEELYVFESAPGAALSAGHTTQLTSGGKVIGLVAGISEDGATIYFVGNGALTNAPNAQGETAIAGDCSGSAGTGSPPGALCDLYELKAGVTKLVAVLSGEDQSVWTGTTKVSGWTQTSGNGQWMTFMSSRPLTGYNNRDAVSGVRDTEVFIYDAVGDGGKGQLVCVSCNPTHALPHGLLERNGGGHTPLADAYGTWTGHTIGGILPAWTSPLSQPRYLSDSGRVLFDSFDALVPSDTNNTGDVYEYEPPGVGGCTAADASFVSSENGCVGLLSSGTGGEAAFLDASESGNDVFFLSPAQLAPQDVDTILDVYDARVGGGFPLPAPVPACEGDACQSMVAAPNDATPGSLAFHGPGNVKPPAVAPPAKKTTKRTAAQIRVEKLAKALRLCRKKHSHKRARCEKQARKKYGASRASRTTTNRRAGR